MKYEIYLTFENIICVVALRKALDFQAYSEALHQQFYLMASSTFPAVIILSGSNFCSFPPSAGCLILK